MAVALVVLLAFRLRSQRIAAFHYRMLLDSTAEGIYTLDPHGRCIWSNQEAARIFGYASPAAYVGKQMHDVIHHTRADGTPFPEVECQGLRGLLAGAGVMQFKELLWRADGTSFYAELRVNPVLRDGKMLFACVAFRDITERLRLEEQFRHAQKMEATGRIAAGTAHDFNNLLTVINGYAQLLLAAPGLDARARRQLLAIEQAGNRAASLTRQLLVFSRQEPAIPIALSLNRQLRDAATLLQSTLGDRITLELQIDPALPEVLADVNEIEQVMMNLAMNAHDAMPSGGHLLVRTAALTQPPPALAAQGLRASRCALLEFRDTGCGMDESTRRQMFEPFFTTKPPSQGTGLGLAMVQTIVHESGGAIAVETAPGQGTSLAVYLPALEPAAAAAAAD
ncbi:MAG: two-component system sensor histidine kinase NtrB [Terriglobales bacterium]